MTVHIAYLADEQAGSPTGVRIVEPPSDTQQAQRGNFYAIVDLQGRAANTIVLTERILSAMQRTYYTAKGTQSQVLTETIQSAQQLLQAESEQQPSGWRAGVICAGLMSDRLALAGVGDAFAFVTTDSGDVNVYPPDRLNPTQEADDPLTLWPLHRQKVESGGALLAGGAEWLERLPPRMLAGAAAFVTPENCQNAADGLREQAGVTDIPGMLLVFAWDDPDAVAAAPEGESPPDAPPRTPPPVPPPSAPRAAYASQGSAQGAANRSPRGTAVGLPTALNASPPVTSAPPVAQLAAESRYTAPPPTPAAATRASAPPPPIAAESAGAFSPPAAALAALPAALAAGAVTGLNRARGMFAGLLPDRTAASAAAYASAEEWTPDAALPAHVPAASTSSVAGSGPAFAPPPAASGSRARLFVAIAVILLLLVPTVVAGLYWQQGAGNRGEAESLLDLAEARLLSAQGALDQDDQVTARAMLTEAHDYVLQGEEILGRTSRSSDLLEEIRREQQQVMQITPLYGLTSPLVTFPADASPQRLLVVDQDIYVMDSGRGQVLKYRIDANGETLAGDVQVVLREGDVVNGIPVGPLVDVAWQLSIPGYEDKASLLLLDGNNRVFRYNQVDGSTLVSFGEPPPWQQATQLEVFSDRLYVADEAANQIYRYAPGAYQEAPVPWFQPTTQVRLQGIASLRIDGDLWLLFKDGKVVRYHAGEQVPYSLDDSVALPAQPVDLYVSQAVNDPTLYLADAAEERILFFNKESGDFEGQFQAVEGRPLRGLRSIFIDEVRSSLFILTNEALYIQRLPR